MDYELQENAPEWFDKLHKLPSEYFRDNWYATFWFETGRGDLQHVIDAVGEDKVMFETDFPHPTCLHPNPVEMVSEKMATLRLGTQRKVWAATPSSSAGSRGAGQVARVVSSSGSREEVARTGTGRGLARPVLPATRAGRRS
jgi:hypothetical protein